MVALDANALYWYYGREKLGIGADRKIDIDKFRAFLDNDNTLILPSSALIEAIVFLKEQPKKIQSLIKFCADKRIKIYNVPICHCFSQDELERIQILNDCKLKGYVKNIVGKKIDTETRHIYVFAEIVVLLFTSYYLNSSIRFSELNKEAILSLIGNDIRKRSENEELKQIARRLKHAYSNSKESPIRIAKELYMDHLSVKCLQSIMIVEGIAADAAGNDNYYSVASEASDIARSNRLNHDEAAKYVSDSLKADSEFIKLTEKEIPKRFEKKNYSKHQSLYAGEMISAWIERGKKLQKNDIFDMLCFGVLDYNSVEGENGAPIFLITFDDAMRKFLGSDTENGKLIQHFLL